MEGKRILPAQKEDGNTPKTIHRAAATISRIQLLADQVGVYPPKTIHGGAAAISGGDVPVKKRGRGAPPGNLNALKTGRHIRKTRILRKQLWKFTSEVDALVRLVEAHYGFKTSRSRPQQQKWPVMPDDLRRIYRQRART